MLLEEQSEDEMTNDPCLQLISWLIADILLRELKVFKGDHHHHDEIIEICQNYSNVVWCLKKKETKNGFISVESFMVIYQLLGKCWA